VTTQAAEKLYRVLPEDPDIAVETRLAVGAGGRCEWLGQEAILFQGTRLRRRLEADDGDGALLAVETLVLGRGAMGEAFTQGLVHDAWHIRRDGRLIWADALHFHGDGAGEGTLSPELPHGLGQARALATMLCGVRRGQASRSGAGPGASAPWWRHQFRWHAAATLGRT
jgi:urease accessory protein